MTAQQQAPIHALAANLLADLAARAGDDNVLVSPISVHMALAAVANGAAGPTYEAITGALGMPGATPAALNAGAARLWDLLARLDEEAYEQAMFGGAAEPAVRSTIANGLWLSHRLAFAPAFVAAVRDAYRAEVAGANFDAPETVEIINAWVRERTAGAIPAMLDELAPPTALALVNAVTFKGGWASVFEPARTEEAPFYLPGGGRTPCDLMHQTAHTLYAESDLLQLVALPFKGSDPLRLARGGTFMLVVLPRPGRTPAEAAAFLGANWLAATAALRPQLGEVDLALPRFRVRFDASLNNTLAALGMGVAFEAGRADFGTLAAGEPVWIGEVRHSTTLLVNEEGAEAAGGTAVRMLTLGIAPPPVPMRVDRPFLCAIATGKEWTPLFVGVVNRPERLAASA